MEPRPRTSTLSRTIAVLSFSALFFSPAIAADVATKAGSEIASKPGNETADKPSSQTKFPAKTKDGRPMPAHPKVALVLGGGGARGAAHIGVLKVLEENGMKPDLIVGNSMGSVIGALYCAGIPLDEIEKVSTDGTIKKAFAPKPFPVQMVKKAVRPRIPFTKKKHYSGFYTGESLEEFIEETVGDKYPTIESLQIPLAITAVNLLDGQAYRFTKGDLGKMVRASCSLPPLLKPVEVDGMVLADGGIKANLPTYSAKDLGADIIIAVNVDERIKTVDNDELKSVTGLANRVATIVLAFRDEQFARQADLVIQPDVSGISIVSTSDDDYHKAVEVGRAAAVDALPKLKKLMHVETASGGEEGTTVR